VLSRKEQQTLAAWDDVQPGSLVKAKVTGQNTGGLELKVGPLAAFMPASHVSLNREENLGQYLTQTLTCEVLEVDRDRKRILLSRRSVLQKERESEARETAGRLSSGQVVKGKVTRVEPFGAFVDLGNGVEGLVHVSNLSRKRVENASEVVQPGQQVDVMVLEIKDGGKRIGLGMKQLEPDPWADAARRYPPDTTIEGTVTRLMEFGAFVELEPGLEGLVHVSQLSKDRVRNPRDLVKPGQKLTVRVVSVEPARARIALSRLDPRGALIGSEDSVDSNVIDEAMRSAAPKPLGTNLGGLFKKLKPPENR
jgi:ribosomal protein S1